MTLPRIVERAHRDVLGEGLLWSARHGAVFWTDILGQRLNRLDLGDGAITTWDLPDTIGWVVECSDGDDLIAGLGDAIVRLSLDPLRIQPIARPDHVAGDMRMNDALVDHSGRIWTGSVVRSCDRPDGCLYRLNTDLTLECIDRGYTVTNGPAISADRRWLYHADSPLGLVYRFALGAGGQTGERDVFLSFPTEWGVPDGMACDAAGGLWVAHWGGGCISRFDSSGQRDRVIRLPASQVTNVTFAGAGLDRMFVTSAAVGVDEPLAGSLFEVAPGFTGLPTHRFGTAG